MAVRFWCGVVIDVRSRQVPLPARFLFARHPEGMGRVQAIVYRCIATHLIKKAGFSRKTARTSAVTVISRYASV